jgi:hypothetical protein
MEDVEDHTFSTRRIQSDRGTRMKKQRREPWLKGSTTLTSASSIMLTITISARLGMSSFLKRNYREIPSCLHKSMKREASSISWLENPLSISRESMSSSGARSSWTLAHTGLNCSTSAAPKKECRPAKARRTTLPGLQQSTASWPSKSSKTDQLIICLNSKYFC